MVRDYVLKRNREYGKKKYHFLYHLPLPVWNFNAMGRFFNTDTIDSFIAWFLQMGIWAMSETTKRTTEGPSAALFVAAINQWCDKLPAQVGGWETAWSTQKDPIVLRKNAYEKLLLLKSLGFFSRSQNNIFSRKTVFFRRSGTFWDCLKRK